MAKKIGFGILWFFVIYILSCGIVGGIAGAIAGSKDPANSARAGELAGTAVVQKLGIYILLGSLAAAVFGAVEGIFPGTKTKVSENTKV